MCDPFPYGGCVYCDAPDEVAFDPDDLEEPDPDLWRDEQLLLAEAWKDTDA